jgi:BASS family bile acid:Na+ symporter
MLIRKLSANIGSIIELLGGVFGLLFIPFLIAVWVPRNWQLLLDTQWPTYTVAIGLGAVGMLGAYYMSKLLKLHPANARTIALEAGINNGPLAIAVIVAVYIDSPGLDQILLVPALYSLFIVLLSTAVTLVFRRANVAAEQKIPNLL